MLNGNLSEKFERLEIIFKKSQSRVDHDSIDLIKYFTKLKGNSYKDYIKFN